MSGTIINLCGTSPAENLGFEENLFDGLRKKPAPVLLFYFNDPCVVLGRSNQPDEWISRDPIEADGIPVLRRFTGGGAVFLDWNVLNYSFILPKNLIEGYWGVNWLEASAKAQPPITLRYIDFFRNLLIEGLETGGLRQLTATRTSDISLNGRKISGNAQRISSNLVLHHGTIMLECPLSAIERYLQIPPDRPGIAHHGFITGLREEGYSESPDEVMEWISAAFLRAVSDYSL